MQAETQTFKTELDFPGAEIRTGLQTKPQRVLHCSRLDLMRPAIVIVQNRKRRGRLRLSFRHEKQPLRFEVVLHRAVEVQMVPSQIRKHCTVEPDSICTTQR